MQDDTTPRKARKCGQSASAYQLNTVDKAEICRLQRYFARLSDYARQQRFHGPISEVNRQLLASIMERATCTIIVENQAEDQPVGEGVLVMEQDAAEIALSTADGHQGRGIGRALLSYLERKAVAASARRIFGDTQRTNRRMLALARHCGYRIVRTPGDWTLTRFEKSLVPAAA